MLACWECRNLTDFEQVSARSDSRPIANSKSGVKPHPWQGADTRAPGLYCGACGKPVEADIDELGLLDNRLDFTRPEDFNAEAVADQLTQLRPDASWTRLEIPERLPRFSDVPPDLHPSVLEALGRTGRARLFCHQTEAIEAALSGEHVIQATAAGSGKSLGFTLPVLDRLTREDDATAVFLFPLRALANDQLAALERLGTLDNPWLNSSSFDLALSDNESRIQVARYVGSTPEHEREAIRRKVRLMITTPDMIHASVLRKADQVYADGSSWTRLLRGLRYVIIDELHSYQGVFGSNVGNVIRRLRRLCDRLGASPQFLSASATIGNPAELAERLTGLGPFTVIDDDGSHRRRRIVLICNPPERLAEAPTTRAQLKKKDAAVDEGEAGRPDESGRIAPQTVAIDILVNGALAVPDRLPVRSISFCRSRNAVFQLSERTRGALREARRADLASAVAPYAATFLADDRIEAEGRLRDGSTLAIVSTNALELGIDIPDLSLAVLVGYPGQISSFRQRIGRAGRGGEGLAVLIVGDDPLQQHLARDPKGLRDLLDAPAESVVVNPEAGEIVRRYGLAPAQEELGGIAFEDAQYFGDAVAAWLDGASGSPAKEHRGVPYWHVPWDRDPYEAGIRNAVAAQSYTVMHQQGRSLKPIGELDAGSAPRDAFVPAIWTGPNGELFRVIGFDEKRSEIYCEGPVSTSYQTRGIPVDRVDVIVDHVPVVARGTSAIGYGGLAITRQVFSYKEQHFSGVERSCPVQRPWPPVEFETDGLYVNLNTDSLGNHDRDGSVRAMEHVLLSVAPVLVACDPYDIDSASAGTSVYLYDSFGGGLCLTRVLHDRFDELAALARRVIESCPCDHGCPGCVMLGRRPDGNRNLSKTGALLLLASLAPTVSPERDQDKEE